MFTFTSPEGIAAIVGAVALIPGLERLVATIYRTVMLERQHDVSLELKVPGRVRVQIHSVGDGEQLAEIVKREHAVADAD
jgi:hypothetical protein